MQALRNFLTALQFFTRIPITGALGAWVGFSPAQLRDSAVHFPGVGWVVGLPTAGTLFAAAHALPDHAAAGLVAGALCTAVGVWITGAFHEDGLADTADGLGGHVPAARALEIMKDSRIGTYGAAALTLGLLTKVSLLALLVQARGAPDAAAVVVFAHVTSRWAPLVVLRTQRHVGDSAQSKSKPLAESVTTAGLLRGALWCAPLAPLTAWAAPGLPWAAALAAAALALLWTWRLLARRLGGFTGDGLGATQQLCELGVYLGAALAL